MHHSPGNKKVKSTDKNKKQTDNKVNKLKICICISKLNNNNNQIMVIYEKNIYKFFQSR